MNKILTGLALSVFVLVLAAGVGLLLAFPVMWCWNYAVVTIWDLPEITWGMAWCLSFLSHVMIKSSHTSSK